MVSKACQWILIIFAILLVLGVIAIRIPVASSRSANPVVLGNSCMPSPLDLPDGMRYDQVLWLCSHNAMSNSSEGWVCPNQNWDIESQLQAGIHAQMWDVWEKDGCPVLCHGNQWGAYPGRLPMVEALKIVGKYMRKHPRAVVTLILESYVSSEALWQTIRKAGVDDLCYLLPRGQSWPVLGDMRISGKRLVLFTDHPSEDYLYPMSIWQHAVETPWHNVSEAMSNRKGRGQINNKLFIVNHFVSSWRPSRSTASRVNSMDHLNDRLSSISQHWNRFPSFWVLDFVDIGDGRRFVHQVNKDHWEILKRWQNQTHADKIH